MRSITALIIILVASLANAQTPPNYPASTDNALFLAYGNDSLILKPNELVDINRTCAEPTISFPRIHHHPRQPNNHHQPTKNEKFMILLLDLSLNISTPCTPPIPGNVTSIAAPGLETNRTTYLHWFQGNLTFSPSPSHYLTLRSGENYTIAPYVPPTPNIDDIPHTYGFYLVKQPQGFQLPAEDQKRDLEGLYSIDRIGFDVRQVVEASGGLVAGMYMREQGPEGEECEEYVVCTG